MSDKIINRVAKATPRRLARKVRGLSDRAITWIFVGPTIFLLLAINIFPLIWTINLSFTNFKANRINRAVDYIGLRNYERILTDGDIWLSMQATAHFLFWTIFFQVLIGFTLAWLINRKFKGKDGTWNEETPFIDVTVFGKTAENVNRYCRKGRQVYVEGRLQTRSWEKDGVKRYSTEIVANEVKFLGRGEGQQGGGGRSGGYGGSNQGGGYGGGGSYGSGGDDGIPFGLLLWVFWGLATARLVVGVMA